jgi:hypothetical protein
MSESTLSLIVGFLRDQLRDPTVEFAIGESARHEKSQLDRVVWVHRGGTTDSPSWNGYRDVKTGGRFVRFYPSYDDVMNVEAHITALNEARWETIRRKILNATKDLFGTASRPGSYDKVTDGDKAGVIHGGQVKAVHQFAWRTTIARERRHSLGREPLAELSPSIPATELVTINGIAFAQTIMPLPAAPPSPTPIPTPPTYMLTSTGGYLLSAGGLRIVKG